MLAAFPLALFIICAIVLVALPIGISLQSYFRNRGRRTVICPDNHEAVTVELDEEGYLVAAEGVEARLSDSGRGRQLTAIARVSVVVEDDLAVKVFEAGHSFLVRFFLIWG